MKTKTNAKTKVAAVKPVKIPVTRNVLLAMFATNFKKFTPKGAEEPVDEKTAKAMAKLTLESLTLAMQGAVHPKGVGTFTLPGVFKIVTKKVPAKKMKAIPKGTMVYSPAAKTEVPHKGRKAFTKPATVRVRIRPMAKLKNAAKGL